MAAARLGTVRRALTALRPEIVGYAAQAQRFARRYPPSGRALARWRAAREARLDLVPADVDLRSGLVVDVGANVGDWTAAVLEAVPGARVVAFEPGAAPFARLRERFGADGRVRLVPAAAGAQAGTATFFVTAHDHNSSLRRPRPETRERYDPGWELVGEQRVTVQTVDGAVGDEPVAVLKVDAQGGEGDVLAGAQATLARAAAVLLEVTFFSHYEGDATFPALHELMAGRGFDLVGLSEPLVGREGIVLMMDACYARRDRAGRGAPARR